MDAMAARALLASARVATLATLLPDGRTHQVPITFALDGDTLYTAIDRKPKRSERLQRLRNLAFDPRASVLAHHYDDEDWSSLWWVRADGAGRIVTADDLEHEAAVALLCARYWQYRAEPPSGPAIVISVSSWTGWRAASRNRGRRPG
jgi:PPOX class probable F420-dependent enzyme